MKITKKSYKFGTYAYTEYRVNGEIVKTISEEKRNCGTSWFNDLPSEEESEEVKIGRSEVPHEVDSIIDDILVKDNVEIDSCDGSDGDISEALYRNCKKYFAK